MPTSTRDRCPTPPGSTSPSAPTFSFGENWQRFLEHLPEGALDRATADLVDWLGTDDLSGLHVVDVGSGSGLHSLAMHTMGAARVVSIDVDPASVAATKRLHTTAGEPETWTVDRVSILEPDALGNRRFDLVYSWGVLHHTGDMWRAIDAAAHLVAPGGRLWISLYTAGPAYPRDLGLKERYNRAGWLGRKMMEGRWIAGLMARRARRRRNPLAWNQGKERGMSTYHDIVDWLGGLPYEVAGVDEVERHLVDRGFVAVRVEPRPEGSCSLYLYRRA